MLLVLIETMWGAQDIYSLFHLNRAFKFISKTSIFFFPIVGWSMFLTGKVSPKSGSMRLLVRLI